MKIHFLFCFFFLLTTIGTAQNAIIEKLKADETIYLDFHFYPSTLRMINVDQDTAFNKLIKGVRKLTFYALDTDKMPVTEIGTLISDLEAQEDYEAYLAIDGGSTQQVQILGNAAGDEWMTVLSIEGESYLTYVKGTINWLQLPKVYEAISTQDSESQTGFSILLNFFEEDRRRRQIQREWQQKKEDKQR